jgi:TonB family protein
MRTLGLVILSVFVAQVLLTPRPAQGNGQEGPPPPQVIRKSGGVLQGMATRRVEPTYPPLAKAAGVSGPVVVEVTIDEQGAVISASALSGHPLLKDAAVTAARRWLFTPTSLAGTPVKVIGTITFNFQMDSKPTYVPLGNEGTITGIVNFAGQAPLSTWIDMGQDPECANVNKNAKSEDVVVADGRLANVFVYIQSGGSLDRYSFEKPSSEAVIYQVGCQLVPRVSGMRAGQTLMVVNSDLTTHNVHPVPSINPEWNVSVSPASAPILKRFDRPEVMIPIKCNQHPWEKAYLGVLDHPFFAVTDRMGAFTITGLPAGDYRLAAWHEKYGEQIIDISLEPTEVRNVELSFSPASGLYSPTEPRSKPR